MLFWRNGLFVVGPESAGAHPGPACYQKGGPLTITDANLFLGRIVPDYFPKIFGPNEDQPLSTEIVEEKFTQLTKEINADNAVVDRREFTAEEVALGFLRVASEVMARPIRALTEARGHDASELFYLASAELVGNTHVTWRKHYRSPKSQFTSNTPQSSPPMDSPSPTLSTKSNDLQR